MALKAGAQPRSRRLSWPLLPLSADGEGWAEGE